jgi:hypothetical protein
LEALSTISTWVAAGKPLALVAAGALVALCFVVFNAARTLLYIPQLLICWRDDCGCPTISLWTWSSWIFANASTGLYMWMFLGDVWGLVLNLGNAAMCAATVVVTLVKRRRHAVRLRLLASGVIRPLPSIHLIADVD